MTQHYLKEIKTIYPRDRGYRRKGYDARKESDLKKFAASSSR